MIAPPVNAPLWRLAAASLLAALLCGCATVDPAPPAPAPDWQLSGKLAVVSPRGNGSGQLDWRHYADRFEITLRGPLGLATAELTGSAEQALLVRGEQRWSGSVAELSAQLLGTSLPLPALQYWADGVVAPAPTAPPERLNYDSSGQLSSLHQGGWQLQFSRYQSLRGVAQPGKITGQRGDDRFTLVVQSRLQAR